ncbi:MAG: hypothetical protein QG575_737 [Euryarchaeota archaeon]|nr:hypothetical protein [Euryarchaeota archaeon]
MNPTYEDEDKIIWLKDHDALARMDYVRERWLRCPLRTDFAEGFSSCIQRNYSATAKEPSRILRRLRQSIRSW